MNQVKENQKSNIYLICMIGIMTAVTCILGPLSVPIGPVPVSFTNLAICLSIVILGKKSLISCFIYLLIGLVGLPVFSQFTGGPAKLFGPTGGYLVGFLFLAAIGGYVVDRYENNIVFYVISMVIGHLVVYALGTAWLAVSLHLSFSAALAAGVYPFIIGDMIKIAGSILLGIPVKKALRHSHLM